MWTITRWEIKSTFKSRKFLFIFIFQMVTLLLIIFIFNGVLQMMNTTEEVTLTPSLNEFAYLDVNDPSGIIKDEINPKAVMIHPTTARSPRGGSLLLVEEYNTLPLNASLFLDYSTPMRNIIKKEVESAVEVSSRKITDQIIASMEREQPNVKEEAVGESLPLKLVNKVMVAILLILPLFMFGNLIIDSIVGEKERKTGESLIAMPIPRSHIILGKSLAVMVIMAIQLFIWMIIIWGWFKIPNAPIVYLVLLLTAFPVVGLTNLVAVYSKNYKEAGIGITLTYIIIIGFLIVPALAYISQKSGMGPLILIIKFLSSENITIYDIVSTVSGLVFSSLIFHALAVWLFERDDIVFGPRPGVLRLLRGVIYEIGGIIKKGSV